MHTNRKRLLSTSVMEYWLVALQPPAPPLNRSPTDHPPCQHRLT